jgi:hypothetical protein
MLCVTCRLLHQSRVISSVSLSASGMMSLSTKVIEMPESSRTAQARLRAVTLHFSDPLHVVFVSPSGIKMKESFSGSR